MYGLLLLFLSRPLLSRKSYMYFIVNYTIYKRVVYGARHDNDDDVATLCN